jgi:hypothetical protein
MAWMPWARDDLRWPDAHVAAEQAAAERLDARAQEAQAPLREAHRRLRPTVTVSRKAVTLPDDVEVFLALQRVNDGDWLNQNLYPTLIRAAGQRKSALGIVNLFAFQIAGFADAGYPAAVVVQLHGLVPAWIDALVADKDVASEAKRLYQDLLTHLGQ